MQTKDQETKLENLKKQIHLSNCIDILMKQTLKLMDIINENQKRHQTTHNWFLLGVEVMGGISWGCIHASPQLIT